MLFTCLWLHADTEARWDHVVLQRPASAPTELKNNVVTIPQQLDVKVDMLDRFAGDIDEGYLGGEDIRDIGDRSDLQRGADDDHKVDNLRILFLQTIEEVIRQSLAEESDIRLHDARGKVVVLIVVRIGEIVPVALLFLLLLLFASLTFPHLRLQREFLSAASAVRDSLILDIVENLRALDVVIAVLAASSRGETTVTLHEQLVPDSSNLLERIDVLRVIPLQLASILQ